MNATGSAATIDPEKPTAPNRASDCAVEIQDVHRQFGEVHALRGVSVTIRRGEFFSLLGPSGCGKTTLLRVIAGLDAPDSGVVRIGGVDARVMRAHQRPVNTVFQSYALFPHLTVWENVAFGLRMKKVPRAEIQDRVRRVLEVVAIESLAERRPAQLSGGQKQRVALARAIVNEPQVLLLDEPLVALDLKLRQRLQVELHALQRRLGITFIYVTHDQEEALAMSDRIAVMDAGRVEQIGCAAEIYEHPRTRFVAQFLGSCNLLEGAVQRRAATDVWVQTPLGPLRVALNGEAPRVAQRHRLTLAIRPEKIRIGATPAEENCVRMEVGDSLYTGSGTQYLLARGPQQLSAWTLNSRVGEQGYRLGEQVDVEIPAGGMIVLDD